MSDSVKASQRQGKGGLQDNKETCARPGTPELDHLPVVKNAGSVGGNVHLIFRGGARTGTVTSMRRESQQSLYRVRTIEAPSGFLVLCHNEELAAKIELAVIASNSKSFASSLMKSLARQQDEARRRMRQTE